MSYFDELNLQDWNETARTINGKTSADVELALSKKVRDLEDFKALISPAAAAYIEPMAKLSQELTQKRFGKTMQLYIPLYLSNECTNFCVYCGFNHDNQLTRKILNKEEVLREVEAIKKLGYEHILLVTGESTRHCGVDYLKEMMALIKPHFAQISLEVQPMDVDDYMILAKEGLNAVYVYQETYNSERYPIYHPKGRKANFKYRLETPDRLGKAGVHKVGLGVLLGLEDWRVDSFFTAMHLSYLEKTYWQTRYSIAFPRLRPNAGSFQPNFEVTDRDLLQLICAYRIFNQEIEISLSTRERPVYRDNVFKLGVTTMSAGSSTEPGGYVEKNKELEQFVISDDRTPAEVESMIRNSGYEAVWKDWDYALQL